MAPRKQKIRLSLAALIQIFRDLPTRQLGAPHCYLAIPLRPPRLRSISSTKPSPP